MLNIAKRLLREESGQGMAEYGLILALVAVVAVAALQLMGKEIFNIFEDVTDKLKGETE